MYLILYVSNSLFEGICNRYIEKYGCISNSNIDIRYNDGDIRYNDGEDEYYMRLIEFKEEIDKISIPNTAPLSIYQSIYLSIYLSI
jgi:hypothetical protein